MNADELPRIAHDPQAFEAFYREHVEAVQRFVARRVGDPYLAADLTAEVFLAAIDAAGGYRRERGSPAAWLFGVARIVVAAEHRRGARERRAHARLEGRRLLGEDDLERMRERIDAARSRGRCSPPSPGSLTASARCSSSSRSTISQSPRQRPCSACAR